MAWQVVWSEKSVKQLEKIDKKDAQRIYDRVLDCANDPFRVATRLTGSPFFRLRVGSYRVILDLQQNNLVVFVIQVDLRKRIYK
jgi:mRNA interferase RelE/StbE